MVMMKEICSFGQELNLIVQAIASLCTELSWIFLFPRMEAINPLWVIEWERCELHGREETTLKT
jgi:hypothetical protein